MGGNDFPHVVSPSTSADPPVHFFHRPRPYRHAVANASAWSWARLLQLGMLVLLLLAVLAAVSVVFGLLLKQLGRCLKRRRRKALARTFNRSPEAGSTAPLFQFSPRMSSGQFNLGSTLGNSFRCGGQRFPTIQVVASRERPL
uniref:Uncharacterized protein n=1 Tax=Bursaphelenchus xylophilus TaxID=6326 RepID=A0A1I7RTI4_BURXY